MGTYYSIYAEVRVGDKWYNLNPMFQRDDGNLDVCSVISGRGWLRDAYDELEESKYACGRPKDLSKEVGTIFCHADDESFEPHMHINTYKDFYDRAIFLVNYGKSVKNRVKANKPTRYRGYASKVSIASFEIDEYDYIGHWLTDEEYEKLSDKQKQEYAYYEWDEPDDWYKAYNMIVDRVDAMLGYFCRWADYALTDADLDERYPTADYVRLIVYRN